MRLKITKFILHMLASAVEIFILNAMKQKQKELGSIPSKIVFALSIDLSLKRNLFLIETVLY